MFVEWVWTVYLYLSSVTQIFLSTKGFFFPVRSLSYESTNFPFLKLKKNEKMFSYFSSEGQTWPSRNFWNSNEKKHVTLLHSKWSFLMSQLSRYKLPVTYSYTWVSSWGNLTLVMWCMWSDFGLLTQLKVANPWDLRQKTWTKDGYKLLQKLRKPFLRRGFPRKQ